MYVPSELKPYIKYPGGKTKLLKTIWSKFPKTIDIYLEPFFGGGSVFFYLLPRIKKAYISDISADIIDSLEVIRDNPEELMSSLGNHSNTKDYFYQIRAFDREKDYRNKYSKIELVSRFIYLNKTCFNGLYRVNSKGEFNTSYGKYKNPKFFDKDNILKISKVLNEKDINIQCASFQNRIDDIWKDIREKENVFAYFDPPYIPYSATANFTQYYKDGFNYSDHKLLQYYCNMLNDYKIKFMQSNSTNEIVLKLYSKYQMEYVNTVHCISASSIRPQIKELLITNYKYF